MSSYQTFSEDVESLVGEEGKSATRVSSLQGMRKFLLVGMVALAVLFMVAKVSWNNSAVHETSALLEGAPAGTPVPKLLKPSVVRAILDKEFQGIDGGAFFPSYQTDSFEPSLLCASLSYDKPVEEVIRTYLNDRRFKLSDFCGANSITKDDPTCRGLAALVSAMFAIEARARKEGAGPAFANSVVSDWTSKDLSSVATCKRGSVSAVTVQQPYPGDDQPYAPPQATLIDPNGCNVYALCDIVTNVVMHGYNQGSTGLCGAFALMNGLSMVNPSKALRVALELFWNGGVYMSDDEGPVACPAFMEAQPGLVPFNSNSLGYPKVGPGTVLDVKPRNSPLQPAGLGFYGGFAIQSQIWRRQFRSCPSDLKQTIYYPGMTKADNKVVEDNMGMSTQGALTICDTVLFPGQSCRFKYNNVDCLAGVSSKFFISGARAEMFCDFFELQTGEPYHQKSFLKAAAAAFQKMADSPGQYSLVTVPMENAFIRDELIRLAGIYGLDTTSTGLIDNEGEGAALQNFSQASLYAVSTARLITSLTGDMLDELIMSGGAMVAIDDEGLQIAVRSNTSPDKPFPLPKDTKIGAYCNHWVVLVRKEANAYVLWTWGQFVYVTRDFLIGTQSSASGGANNGSICIGIVAPAAKRMLP